MNNREEWLMQAVDHIKPIFERMGYQVSAVKVSVGFSSMGPKGRYLENAGPPNNQKME